MKHLGDITKINGYEAPIVDVITGGSPCQDLSVAGKRAGLAGERSGLFMEQIRLIKEMRENDRRTNGRTDKHIRPRYMVWENVPGAFSSNNGEDFRAVLEETAKVAKGDASIPGAPNGKWPHAGCIMGDGWSIAWRVHDAQYWGVPQRRKRISLVADFGGRSAPKILFECKGMSGDIEESGEPRKDAATDAGAGTTQAGRAISFQERAGKPGGGKGILIQDERTGALSTLNNQAVICLEGNGSRPSHQGDGWHEGDPMYTLNSTEYHAVALENHPQDSRVKIREDGKVQTLSSRMGTGGGNVPLVFGRQHDVTDDDITPSLCAKMGTGGNNVPMVLEPYTSSKASYHQHFTNDGKAETLVASDYKDPPTVTYGLDRAAYNQGMNAQFDFAVDSEKIGTQVAKGPGAVCNNYVVRRLTPLECERLQGFPDHWTDIGEWVDSKGKKHKDADSPRYKALGNSIALPFWEWMADRMCKQLREDGFEDLTMASLFDGIGGFPLVYSRCDCKPVWASEIEEFPIAVTKYHFGEE